MNPISKFKPKKNDFAMLQSDDEDDDFNDDEPENEEAKPIPSNNETGGRLSYSDLFRKRTSKAQIKNIIDLAQIVEDVLRVKSDERNRYVKYFDSYEKYDIEQYSKIVDQRLNCFSDRDEEDFINQINFQINQIKNIDLNALLSWTYAGLGKKKRPDNHGGMYLLEKIALLKPQLFSTNVFSLNHEKVQLEGPIICWIIGNTIKHNVKVLSTNDLLSIFIKEFVNSSATDSGAISVYAAHIVADYINLFKDYNVNSTNFLKCCYLVQKSETNRDRHVKDLISPFIQIFNEHITDLENLPEVICSAFNGTPAFALVIFAEKAYNPQFLKGWIKAHEKYKERSNEYLQKVSPNLTSEIIQQFPISDLKNSNNEVAEVALLRSSLNGSSWRFLIIIILILVVFYGQQYLDLLK